MKIKILVSCILSISILHCHTKDTNPPIIDFDSQVIDVGTITEGIAHKDSFFLRNSGSSILQIDEITTDCGCTIAKTSVEKIKPHDSGKIVFSVNPNTIGYFQQKIIIKNNSNINPILFIVRGKRVANS